MRDIIYILSGYLAGSILFARVFGQLLKYTDITENTNDGNPGTANAFHNGGFLCGVLTLICDLLKGFLPVFLYTRGTATVMLALVMAAPVIGHVFPVLFRFRGGKGIATTFGCLLGLLPNYIPVGLLALLFIFFSLILRITPHYYRTLATYLGAELLLFVFSGEPAVWIGFSLILAAVTVRMLTSKEEKTPPEVKLLWMR